MDEVPAQPGMGAEVGAEGEFRAASRGARGLLLPLLLSAGRLRVHLLGPQFPYLW